MRSRIYFSFFLFLGMFWAFSAQAICPVCTIAVGAGIGLSRWLGIDDSITGLWVGALMVSLTIWTAEWLKKKKISFFAMKTVILFVYVIFVIFPLYFMGIMGHPFNTLWGVDKLALGITLGGVGFFLGATAHFYLKKKNDDRVYFPFQKVAFTILPVLILSVVFYFLTHY